MNRQQRRQRERIRKRASAAFPEHDLETEHVADLGGGSISAHFHDPTITNSAPESVVKCVEVRSSLGAGFHRKLVRTLKSKDFDEVMVAVEWLLDQAADLGLVSITCPVGPVVHVACAHSACIESGHSRSDISVSPMIEEMHSFNECHVWTWVEFLFSDDDARSS